MNLHTMPSVKKPAKRVGRGTGSGSGKTAGRGTKGQKSRTGHHAMPAAFEGGQMPLHMRLPKLRGFKNPTANRWTTITLSQLAQFSGKKLDLESAQQAGLATRQTRYLKVIGSGAFSKELTIEVHRISAGARKALVKAGGTIHLEEPTVATPKTTVTQEQDA